MTKFWPMTYEWKCGMQLMGPVLKEKKRAFHFLFYASHWLGCSCDGRSRSSHLGPCKKGPHRRNGRATSWKEPRWLTPDTGAVTSTSKGSVQEKRPSI